MKFDRNTVIGFALLAVLFFFYFYITSVQQKEAELYKRYVQDSLNKLKSNISVTDSIQSKKIITNTKNNNTKDAKVGILEKRIAIENDFLKIVFSNKGGKPVFLALKKYKSHNEQQVVLIDTNSFNLSYTILHNNVQMDVNDITFERVELKQLNYNAQSVEFIYTNRNNNAVLVHSYTIHPSSYLIDFKIHTNNPQTFFTSNEIPFVWTTQMLPHESNLKYEQTQAQFSLMTTENDFDYFSLGSEINEQIDEPLKWVSIKQQFFNNTLINEKGSFKHVSNYTSPLSDSGSKFFIKSKTSFTALLSKDKDTNSLALQLFYGPTDYEILKQHQLEKIINIGQGFYAFVKYVNRFVVIPIFDFLQSLFSNYGIVILLLTIFIRIITVPLLYTSYTSAAKMKILKPELDELKKKMGDDQQGYAMKQMELFRSAGVNPLGGCIPALLQIPIFLSLFYFFNSCIDLRGQSFLWAKDLSSYDSIYTFSFSIPFYGNHISLFTLLNVITTFLTSYMSTRNTPDQGNPMLKYMPYIFPVVLLGFFNSLPSALTWYYTVSNSITLVLQYVIQNFIINHDKLLKQIEEKKKQPQKKSVWMQRVAQVQNSQKKLAELKERTKHTKK